MAIRSLKAFVHMCSIYCTSSLARTNVAAAVAVRHALTGDGRTVASSRAAARARRDLQVHVHNATTAW